MPRGKRLLLLGIVSSLVLTAAIAIAILLFGDFRETEGRVLATTAFVSFFTLLSLPGGVLLDQARLAPLAWATVALAAVAFALAMVVVWAESETALRLAGSAAAAAVAATQTAALATGRRADDSAAVRRLFASSTVLVGTVATLVIVAIWAPPGGDVFVRVLAALAVADVLLVVLQPVLRRGRVQPAPLRLRVTLADGTAAEVEAPGRDFADAAARAIRRAERDGAAVQAVERVRS